MLLFLAAFGCAMLGYVIGYLRGEMEGMIRVTRDTRIVLLDLVSANVLHAPSPPLSPLYTATTPRCEIAGWHDPRACHLLRGDVKVFHFAHTKEHA